MKPSRLRGKLGIKSQPFLRKRLAKKACFLVVTLSCLVLYPALSLGEGLSLGQERLLDNCWGEKLFPEGLSPALLEGDIDPVQTQMKVDFDSKTVNITKTLAGREYEPTIALNIDHFVKSKLREDFYRGWQKSKKGGSKSNSGEKKFGTLEIEIPVKFPRAISRAIGQGGSLRVTGSRRISLSGRSEWTEGQAVTATSRPSKFPSLNMEQKSRFRIEGTVGERIHVQVEQDSERQTELENSIKIRYDGDEDRITQEIEAGNTMLSLPGTQFVGYSAQHKGLFGIRAKEKIGGVDLSIIASQEKGSTQKKTFRGLAQESSKKIWDYQYLANTYFFLDYFYRDQFKNQRDEYGVVSYDPDQRIEDIEVYIDDNNFNNNVEMRAVPGWAVYMDSARKGVPDSVRGHFHPLDPTDYFVDRNLGYIVLDPPVRDDYLLAVAYRSADGVSYGDIDYVPGQSESITLKLIKPKSQRPEDPTWDYQWRNIYDLGTRDITPEGFEVKIYRDLAQPEDSQDGVPYLQIFGLDKHGQDAGSPPDGLIDLDEAIINRQRGELIFPDLNPFNPGPESKLKEKVPQIYESRDEQTKREASKYFIEVKSLSRQTKFNLGQFNIIEGTEVVKLNGTKLTRGTDYQINYHTSEITFFTDEVLNPAADLTIDYEYTPFFMPQQKTLLGLRGEYKFLGQSSAGMTLLYNSEKATEQRVKVGGEPSRTILWDTDINLKFSPRLMTQAVDLLPLSKTDARSSLGISGEVALSLPNQNTRGDAYIDDFEGSTNRTSFGVMRALWTKASAPVGTEESHRGRLIWYNPWDRVPVREIWPNRQTSAQESQVHVLNLEFTPLDRSHLTGFTPESPLSWAGIMRSLPGGSKDFSRDKFLEIWVKGDKGVLNIDLGAVSEDVIPNGLLDTEDKIRYGQRDGILQEDEDTGLDGLSDQDEPGYDPQTNPDPHRDNWRYDDKYDYSRINETEGNKSDPDRGWRPDTEDINASGYLDLDNDYYTYSIDLSADGILGGEPGGILVQDTRSHGWRLLRIPLWEEGNFSKQGNPDPTQIEFVRLWLTGVDSETLIQIASLEIVGNDWQELGIGPFASPDERFGVTVKNTHENRDYSSPPGIEVEKDPLTNIARMEQSLVLKFENLKPGHQAFVYRTLFRPEDYTHYREMKVFVYGASPGTEFIIRFGADKDNYYQCKASVQLGEWSDIVIDLEKITQLKGDPADSLRAADLGYSMEGNPSLSDIRRFELGVANPGPHDISGEIWVNELRLSNARDVTGVAERISVDAGFADLLNLNVNYRRKNSEFHSLREKTGSGSEDISRSLRGDLKLDRFLPSNWGISIPAGLSWEESVSRPRLMPFSDVVLSDPDREKSLRKRKTASISFRKRAVATNPLIGWTLDRMSASLSFTGQEGQSPQRPQSSSWSYNGSFRYDLSPRSKRSVQILGWTKFYYLPSKLSFSTKANNAGSDYQDQHGNWVKKHDFNLDEDFNLTWGLFESVSVNYDFKAKRDLRTNLNLGFKDLRLGNEIDRTQTASVSFRPTISSWFRQDYSCRATYHESNDPRFRRGAERGRDADTKNTLSAKLTLGVPELLKFVKLGKIGERLQPLSGSYTHTESFRSYGLLGRPSLGYQFGFSEETGVDSEPSASQRDSKSASDKIDLSTGLRLFPNISLKAKSRYDYSSRVTSSSSVDNRRITLPALTVRWDRLERFSFLKELVKSSSLDVGYQREFSKRGAPGLKREGLLSSSVKESFQPLFCWTAHWNNGIRSTLKLSRNSSSEDDLKGGIVSGTTNSRNTDLTASVTYSLSALKGIQIPFWGKFKLKSNLDVSIDFSRKTSYREIGVSELSPVPRQDEQEWLARLRMSYQFSRKFTGGANMEFSNRKDKLRDTTRKVREVGFWGEIRLD